MIGEGKHLYTVYGSMARSGVTVAADDRERALATAKNAGIDVYFIEDANIYIGDAGGLMFVAFGVNHPDCPAVRLQLSRKSAEALTRELAESLGWVINELKC